MDFQKIHQDEMRKIVYQNYSIFIRFCTVFLIPAVVEVVYAKKAPVSRNVGYLLFCFDVMVITDKVVWFFPEAPRKRFQS